MNKAIYPNSSMMRYEDNEANQYIGYFKGETPFQSMFVKIAADNQKDAKKLFEECFSGFCADVLKVDTEAWGGEPAPDGLLPMGVIFKSMSGKTVFSSFDEPEW